MEAGLGGFPVKSILLKKNRTKCKVLNWKYSYWNYDSLFLFVVQATIFETRPI